MEFLCIEGVTFLASIQWARIKESLFYGLAADSCPPPPAAAKPPTSLGIALGM